MELRVLKRIDGSKQRLIELLPAQYSTLKVGRLYTLLPWGRSPTQLLHSMHGGCMEVQAYRVMPVRLIKTLSNSGPTTS